MATTTGFPFSFDIVVEDLKVFMRNKQFVIKSQFADVFSLVLKSPEPKDRKRKRKKSKGKTKKAKGSANAKQITQKGVSIVYVGDIDLLMAHMMRYPMEVCLCEASDPEERIASTLIPWKPDFIEYLMSLYHEPNPPPVIIRDAHNVFDETTSKRMAVIRLNIKLHLNENVSWNNYRVLSEFYPNTFILVDDIPTKYINQSTTTIVNESPGVIKTIYSGGKQKNKTSKNKSAKRDRNLKKIEGQKPSDHADLLYNVEFASNIDKSLFTLIKSDTNIAKREKVKLLHPKSCTAIKQINAFDYIFGDRKGPFGKKVYTVGYFTVNDPKSKTTSLASLQASQSAGKLSSKSSPADSLGSLDADLTTSVKCDNVECEYKKERPPLESPDDRNLLGLDSLNKTCCVTESVEQKMEIIGIMQGKMMDPCYCACECAFGFERKTTYCKVCGGYEKAGEDLDGKPQYLMPDPCPIYHKISRIKTGSTSGSEGKKETKRRTKTPEPADKDKEKKKGKDDRFKFNYGYKGIPPQIGHSHCTMPCTGTMSNVPKYMGWLWTADNIPGLMFRPSWKPGAINKVVARKLRMAKNPGEVIAKRRKASGLKKRPLKRPLLVVHKKDGEYNVTMETMKSYAKPRTFNQQPYEDKPVVTYTIGRTEEENLERKRKKERAMRRLEREQREFIQNAFRDMCKEICMKTYQQALGILPDAEDPECTCFPALPGPEHVNVDRSCSCSDGQASLGSDTDSDEWILEFTPPNAYYDPSYPGVKVKTGDKETQYSYLDYIVKLVDRYGNPVPRFFKGPDGKPQCSDLGGFWSPGHNWLEINVDGYIGPDGRWAPMQFIGPSGEQVEAETGKFQATNGNWLVVGVDGYVDCNNKWKFYRPPLGKQKQTGGKQKYAPTKAKGLTTKKEDKKTKKKESEPAFSCFGDATPVELSKMGIVGHGPDKKLLNRILKDMIAKGMNVRIPQGSRVPKSPVSGRSRRRRAPSAMDAERFKCQHRPPSRKGVEGEGYFRTKKFRSQMPKERIHDLEQQGRSLSTFHEPCFHSNMDYRRRPRRRNVIVKMQHGFAGI